MIRAGALALIVLLPSMAGCLSSGGTRDGRAGGPDVALPSSLDGNLHEYVLNITMPASQPTMLVALNVTKDMWVRPFTTSPNPTSIGPGDVGAQRQTTHWVLCPWMRSAGLPDGARYVVIPLWRSGDRVEPAMRFHGLSRSASSDREEGGCVTRVDAFSQPGYDIRDISIAADEPRDGELLLVVFLRVPDLDDLPGPTPMLVGIAAETCEGDQAKLCPPPAELAATSMATAPKVTVAWCGEPPPTGELPTGCEGFTRAEDLPAVDDWFRAGSVPMGYESALERGIRLVGSTLTNSVGSQTLEFATDQGEHEIACLNQQFSYLTLLTTDPGPAQLAVTFNTAASVARMVVVYEIPLDLDTLQLRLETSLQRLAPGGCA